MSTLELYIQLTKIGMGAVVIYLLIILLLRF